MRISPHPVRFFYLLQHLRPGIRSLKLLSISSHWKYYYHDWKQDFPRQFFILSMRKALQQSILIHILQQLGEVDVSTMIQLPTIALPSSVPTECILLIISSQKSEIDAGLICRKNSRGRHRSPRDEKRFYCLLSFAEGVIFQVALSQV